MMLPLNQSGAALVKRLIEEHLMDTCNNRSAAVATRVLTDLNRALTNRVEPSADLARLLKEEFPWLGTDEGDVSGDDVIEQLELLYSVWTEKAHA